MAQRGSESAVIRRSATEDNEDDAFYGDRTVEAAVAHLDSIMVWPRASQVSSERGVTTIEGLHIFVPPDGVTWAPDVPEADRELRPDDMILVRDKEWRMDGAVGDWRKKSGSRTGWLFEVERWSA